MIEKYYLGTCPICSLSLEDRDTILTAFTLNLCPLTSSESLGLPGCPATSHQSFTLNFDDYFTQSPLSSNHKYFLPLLHSQLTSVPVSLRKQKIRRELSYIPVTLATFLPSLPLFCVFIPILWINCPQLCLRPTYLLVHQIHFLLPIQDHSSTYDFCLCTIRFSFSTKSFP